MSPSAPVEQLIRERSARIERFHESIIRCHVVVDVPHRHQRRGRMYSVRLDIRTPTGEIVVTHEHPLAASSQEIDTAVRAAFDTATRQLEDDVRRRRSS